MVPQLLLDTLEQDEVQTPVQTGNETATQPDIDLAAEFFRGVVKVGDVAHPEFGPEA